MIWINVYTSNVHVDDFAIASECSTMTIALHDHIKSRYKIDETDTLEHFIGVNISYRIEDDKE